MNVFPVYVHPLYLHFSYVPVYSNNTDSITLKMLCNNNNNNNNHSKSCQTQKLFIQC